MNFVNSVLAISMMEYSHHHTCYVTNLTSHKVTISPDMEREMDFSINTTFWSPDNFYFCEGVAEIEAAMKLANVKQRCHFVDFSLTNLSGLKTTAWRCKCNNRYTVLIADIYLFEWAITLQKMNPDSIHVFRENVPLTQVAKTLAGYFALKPQHQRNKEKKGNGQTCAKEVACTPVRL